MLLSSTDLHMLLSGGVLSTILCRSTRANNHGHALCWHLVQLTWLTSGVLEGPSLFSGMLDAGLSALDVLRRVRIDLVTPCACDGPGAVAVYTHA